MNNLNIDTEKLNTKKEEIKIVLKDLETLFEKIQKETETLKDFWETRTSENVFNNFQEFYKTLENVKTNFRSDISFIEKKVNEQYIKKDNEISTQIDEKIA